jgi:hypothetical protein
VRWQGQGFCFVLSMNPRRPSVQEFSLTILSAKNKKLKELGFQWKKTRNSRVVLIKKNDVRCFRIIILSVSGKHFTCNFRTMNREDWSIITILFTYDQLLLAESKVDLQRVTMKLNEIMKEYNI